MCVCVRVCVCACVRVRVCVHDEPYDNNERENNFNSITQNTSRADGVGDSVYFLHTE